MPIKIKCRHVWRSIDIIYTLSLIAYEMCLCIRCKKKGEKELQVICWGHQPGPTYPQFRRGEVFE